MRDKIMNLELTAITKELGKKSAEHTRAKLQDSRRVRHTRGGRDGWEGTITSIPNRHMIVVTWDTDKRGRALDPPRVQNYSADALKAPGVQPFEYGVYPYQSGYLEILDSPTGSADSATDQWIIVGKCGGSMRRFTGSYEDAKQLLGRLAGQSRSGQPYQLFQWCNEAVKTAPVQFTKE